MHSIARIDVPATPMVLEYSSLPHGVDQGTHASTLELFQREDSWMIEWDIPTLERTEHIGIWADSRKRLTDYDGVFSLPREVIAFLRAQGFVVPREFID